MKKGISPVIATVILVAVALVLAVALAGWTMGIWGTLGSTEALYITGYINKSVSGDVYVNATIYNKGTAQTNVTKVEFVDNDGDLESVETEILVGPGSTNTTAGYLNEFDTASVGIGRTYVVRFYTSSGNVYEVPMRCVRG